MTNNERISSNFGHRIRVRVCGILMNTEKILMAKHRNLGEAGHLWIPPGGGMEFGADARDNLVREFHEETGLNIEVGELLFVNEFLKPPLHAMELFYKVAEVSGQLMTGTDPEFGAEDQILEEVKFMSFEELSSIPTKNIHNAFNRIRNSAGLINFDCFFNLTDNYLI